MTVLYKTADSCWLQTGAEPSKIHPWLCVQRSRTGRLGRDGPPTL